MAEASDDRILKLMCATTTSLRPIHPFPARMAPTIVQRRLRLRKQLRVLDPMVGSGTTIVAARLSGHHAVGFDTDPLALVIAKTWSSNLDSKRLLNLSRRILAKATTKYTRLSHGHAYPDNSDRETRSFIRFWFDPTNRRQLTALSMEILKVKDLKERSFLWSAFSKLIVTKDAGRISRTRRLSTAVRIGCTQLRRSPAVQTISWRSRKHRVRFTLPLGHDAPTGYVERGRCAGNLPVKDESVDLVLTSPPYLNAIDYLRGHKLTLVWMGHSVEAIRTLRAHNIGAESAKHSTTRDMKHIDTALEAMCDRRSYPVVLCECSLSICMIWTRSWPKSAGF